MVHNFELEFTIGKESLETFEHAEMPTVRYKLVERMERFQFSVAKF